MSNRSTRSCVTALAVWGAIAALLAMLVDARTRGLLENSLWLAACTALTTLPVGLVLATLLVKFDIPCKRVVWILLVSGLFLPLYLVTTAWQSALGLQGWVAQLVPTAAGPAPVLAGWSGAVFIHSVWLLPAVTLLMAVGLASTERELEEDSLLRMPPLAVLRAVTFHRAAGAFAAAAVWIFVVCMSEMTVTDIFQIRTFAEEIYVQTAGGAVWDLAGITGLAPLDTGESPASFLLGTLLIGWLLVPAVWWCLRLVPRWQRAGSLQRWMMRPRHGGNLLAAGLVLVTLALIAFPLASLVYHAGLVTESIDGGFASRWSLPAALAIVFRSPVVHGREFVHTAVIGSAAATAATFLAGLLGVWSAFRPAGKIAAGTLAAVLAALPGPLVGLWLIETLNRPPDSPLSFLAVLYDEAAFGFAPWLAQTLRVLPFAIIVAVPALARTPRSLLEAATLDGAGPVAKIAHLFLPLHWRSLAVAWLVAFVLAVGELPATVLVAPPGVTPLSVRIFNLVHYGVDDQLAGLVLFVWLSVLLLTTTIVLVAGLGGRTKV